MEQEKFLLVGDKKIFYSIRKSKKAKNIKVAVYNTGEVLLTVPFFMGVKWGEKFLERKREWLYKKVPSSPDPVRSSEEVRKDYLTHKETARKLARQRIDHFNQFYNVSVQRISIRNQRTRWGSCSQKGNLNFNYKIVKLPEHLSDYIIVHELCHLQEMNHSRRFWELVEKSVPDHKERRKELKKWREVNSQQ